MAADSSTSGDLPLFGETHGDGDDAALVVDFAAVTTSGGNTGAKEIQFWGMPSQ